MDDADPFEGKTDQEVLKVASVALRRVQGAPVGSFARQVQWAIYEQAKAELDLRMLDHVLRKVQGGSTPA